jgi:hypothetical protein
MGDGFTVPTDWTEENGYALGVVCFPNSLQWRVNVQSAIYLLTRARAYDFSTGNWKAIEDDAIDVWESFMACDFQTLIDLGEQHIKTQRMIVAALMGHSINFDSEELPNAINYENGIRQAILSVGGQIGTDMTLAELIAQMEAADGPDYGFKDWLEILKLFQDLFNGAGLVPVAAIGGLITAIFAARTSHNTLAIQAMQATALRGIQNAISPPKDPTEEETTVTSWMDTLEKIPYLTTAIVAIVDPSPAGEGTLAVKLALSLKNLTTTAFGWITNWWNNYVNTVGNPQPAGTIVGMLSEISRKIQSLTDEQTTPTVTVSNRLKTISDAIEGIEVQGVDLTPTLVEIVTALNEIALPEGVTWQSLFTQITDTMGETMPIINVTCGQCGSSSGCGCGGSGTNGAYGPGVNTPEDKPPVELTPGTIPNGFPDLPAYDVYKCKASNVLTLNLAEVVFQMGSVRNIDLSQYESWQATREIIYLEVRIGFGPFGTPSGKTEGWIADKIMEFAYPYPSDESPNLAIFADIRLNWLTDREANVCGLYNSSSTSEARDFIQGVMDGYIDATSYDANVKIKAKSMIAGILSNAWLGRLFQKDSFINVYSDESSIDCSACITDNGPFFFGEDIAQDGDEWDVSSSPTSGGHYVAICFNVPATFNVSMLSGSMIIPLDFPDCWTQISETSSCCGGGCLNTCWTTIYDSHVLGDFEDVYTVQYRSGTAFRLRFTVSVP